MTKEQTMKFNWKRFGFIASAILICVFCACTFSACMGLEQADTVKHNIQVDWFGTDNSWETQVKYQGMICASSEKIIWDAIKEIGEDNFKKYVLGVK